LQTATRKLLNFINCCMVCGMEMVFYHMEIVDVTPLVRTIASSS